MKIGIYLPVIAVGTALLAIFSANFGFLSDFTLQVFGIPANLVFWFVMTLFVCVLTVLETKKAINNSEDE